MPHDLPDNVSLADIDRHFGGTAPRDPEKCRKCDELLEECLSCGRALCRRCDKPRRCDHCDRPACEECQGAPPQPGKRKSDPAIVQARGFDTCGGCSAR